MGEVPSSDHGGTTDLLDRSLNGILWVAVDRMAGSGVNFVITLVLARLLFPEDFGIVAMAMVFFELSSVFVESGFSTALIRKGTITEADRSTAFLFNLVSSAVLYLMLFLFAPSIARFFDEPVLTLIIRVMGINLIIDALAIVQGSTLSQRIDFKTQAKARIGAVVLSGTVGVALALGGSGVWAIVARIGLMALGQTALLWYMHPWRPSWRFSLSSFRDLFGFGSRILLAALLDKAFGQAYKLVIGKFFTAATLGFYGQASGFVNMVINTLFRTIQTVSYPVLANLQGERDRLKNGYRTILRLSSFVILPVLVVLGVLAEPVLVALLGEKWAPSAPFLQLLCIAGATYHLSSVNLNVLLVLGRSDLSLKLEVIKKVNIAIAILVGLRYGIIGLVWGEVIVAYINLLVNLVYSRLLLDYTWKEQLRDILPTLLISGGLGVGIHYAGMAMDGTGLPGLVAMVLAAAVIYVLAHRVAGTGEWRILTARVVPAMRRMIGQRS